MNVVVTPANIRRVARDWECFVDFSCFMSQAVHTHKLYMYIIADAICTISEHHYIFTSAHSPSCIDRLIYCFTVHITRQYHSAILFNTLAVVCIKLVSDFKNQLNFEAKLDSQINKLSMCVVLNLYSFMFHPRHFHLARNRLNAYNRSYCIFQR